MNGCIFFTMLKKFILYALRWQLSTPVMAPVVAYCMSLNWGYIAALAVANFVGACIFFWVDKFIFGSKIKTLWEVKDHSSCFACGKQGRSYRLFKAKNYDRTDDKHPEFLCEVCSRLKVEELKKRGVIIL